MVAIKSSLALLTVGAALLGDVAAKKHNHNYGRHMKMARRGDASLFDDLARRDGSGVDVAPFGYDRCGVPRTKPYVRKPSASPQPSQAKWKACPPGTPGYTGASVDVAKDANGQVLYPQQTMGVATTDSSATSDDSDADVQADADAANAAASAAAGNANTANAAPKAAVAVADAGSAQEWSSTSVSYDSSSSNTWTPTPTDSTTWTDAPSSTANTWTEAPSSSSASPSTAPVAQAQAKFAQPNAAWGGNNGEWGQASSSSSSAVAAPAYTPSASTSNSGKLGLAWDWRNPTGVLQNWAGASKIYTWSAYPPSDALPSGMEWLPQFWGPAKEADFSAQVAAGVIKPGMTILAYNEPDQPGQSNLAVSDAVTSYKNQITPYASQGYRLTTPACVNDDKGYAWIKGFIDGCAGQCGFSAVQTHWYGTDAQKFIEYMTLLHNSFGLPVIVSEFAAETFGNGADLDYAGTQAFLGAVQAWAKTTEWLESYFYFGPETSAALNGVNPNNQMMSDAGVVNALGWQYLSSA